MTALKSVLLAKSVCMKVVILEICFKMLREEGYYN